MPIINIIIIEEFSNEVIKRYARKNYNTLVAELDPSGSLLNTLFQEEVINIDQKVDIGKLVSKEKRSEALLDFLFCSSNEEAFVVLRKALINDYRNVVDEIDKFNRQGNALQLIVFS